MLLCPNACWSQGLLPFLMGRAYSEDHYHTSQVMTKPNAHPTSPHGGNTLERSAVCPQPSPNA